MQRVEHKNNRSAEMISDNTAPSDTQPGKIRSGACNKALDTSNMKPLEGIRSLLMGYNKVISLPIRKRLDDEFSGDVKLQQTLSEVLQNISGSECEADQNYQAQASQSEVQGKRARAQRRMSSAEVTLRRPSLTERQFGKRNVAFMESSCGGSCRQSAGDELSTRSCHVPRPRSSGMCGKSSGDELGSSSWHTPRHGKPNRRSAMMKQSSERVFTTKEKKTFSLEDLLAEYDSILAEKAGTDCTKRTPRKAAEPQPQTSTSINHKAVAKQKPEKEQKKKSSFDDLLEEYDSIDSSYAAVEQCFTWERRKGAAAKKGSKYRSSFRKGVQSKYNRSKNALTTTSRSTMSGLQAYFPSVQDSMAMDLMDITEMSEECTERETDDFWNMKSIL